MGQFTFNISFCFLKTKLTNLLPANIMINVVRVDCIFLFVEIFRFYFQSLSSKKRKIEKVIKYFESAGTIFQRKLTLIRTSLT